MNFGGSVRSGTMSASAASPAIGIPSAGPSPKIQRAANSLIPGGRGTSTAGAAGSARAIDLPRASRVEVSTIRSGVRAAVTVRARRSPPARAGAETRASTLEPSSLERPITA
jgi:hypothetical protein